VAAAGCGTVALGRDALGTGGGTSGGDGVCAGGGDGSPGTAYWGTGERWGAAIGGTSGAGVGAWDMGGAGGGTGGNGVTTGPLAPEGGW
jgi:hypothetical protein